MKYKVTNNVEMLNEEFNLEEYNMTNDDYEMITLMRKVKKKRSTQQWIIYLSKFKITDLMLKLMRRKGNDSL